MPAGNARARQRSSSREDRGPRSGSRPGQHADRVEHRVEAEDANRARLGLQEARAVLDQRRLARAVFADQPEDGPPRDLQIDTIKSQRPAEPARSPWISTTLSASTVDS